MSEEPKKEYTPEQIAKLEVLHRHRNMHRFVIGILSGIDDPRQPDAMAHYQASLAKVDAEIAEITGKPPDIVVGLKPAILFPKAEGVKKI